MCGKVYKLAPVTLTEREQSVHQEKKVKSFTNGKDQRFSSKKETQYLLMLILIQSDGSLPIIRLRLQSAI
ncbi:hypothetical protein DY000_02055217 [Brassica cretica]|uniref:Uncharacterized protein n=1 Tax=Brassica cretica TaxID=69181 RepID=A0ABQ7ACI9_BRACR|nr:hypothetical protein DY000_02055217 [Brassica cretica]